MGKLWPPVSVGSPEEAVRHAAALHPGPGLELCRETGNTGRVTFSFCLSPLVWLIQEALEEHSK